MNHPLHLSHLLSLMHSKRFAIPGLLICILAITSSRAHGEMVQVTQSFSGSGSPYIVLQTQDTHAGNGTLAAPKVVHGGPWSNYLQLAKRDAGNGIDATNAIIFSNTASTFGPINFKLKYHMEGLANGFGFVLMNTEEYGASGGTVSSLGLDRIQVEQAHNNDPVGSQQSEYFRKSFHLALNTFEQDRVQLFYDGYKLFETSTSFLDGWYELSMQVQYHGLGTTIEVRSNRFGDANNLFNFQLHSNSIAAFNARPMLASRIGGVGYGDFSIDEVSFVQGTESVPEPSTIVLAMLALAGFPFLGSRMKRSQDDQSSN